MDTGTLYYGDCLDWMSKWNDHVVDLIYLDPPFNSSASYNILFSDDQGGAQYRAFDDTWYWDAEAAKRYEEYEGAVARPAHNAITGLFKALGPSGMMAYLTYMAERLEQMHRILKPTGSIYLHCDPTASHYLKVVMDGIFGKKNFRNELAWKRTSTHSDARRYARASDRLLFYAFDGATWNTQYSPHTEKYIDRDYRHKDKRGRYRVGDLTGAGLSGGEAGDPWHGYDPGVSGRHWSVPRTGRYAKWIEDNLIPGYLSLNGVHERLDALSDNGLIERTATGYPRLKRYLAGSKGRAVSDFVADIQNVNNRSNEYLGYPTQKPLALLERILQASSNEGDVVLDPFCGCGTAIESAQLLKRQWAGIDISPVAIDIVKEKRLRNPNIPTQGIPADLASARKLAREAPFDFEGWAVTRLPGFVPNTRRSGDHGIDGRAKLAIPPDRYPSKLALSQVKGGKFNLSYLRDFNRVADRDQGAVNCFITLERVTSSTARAEAAGMQHIKVQGRPFERMQLWSIQDYFDGRKPDLPIMLDPYTGKPANQTTLALSL